MFNTSRFNVRNSQNLPKIPFKFYPKGYDANIREEVYRALGVRKEDVNSSVVFVEYLSKGVLGGIAVASDFSFYYFPSLNSVVVGELYPSVQLSFKKYTLKGKFSEFIWNTFKNPDILKSTENFVKTQYKMQYNFNILQDAINYFSMQNCTRDIDSINKDTLFSDVYTKLPVSNFDFRLLWTTRNGGAFLDQLEEGIFVKIINILSGKVLDSAMKFQRVDVDYHLKTYSACLPYTNQNTNKGLLYFLAVPVDNNAIYPIVVDYKGTGDYVINTLEEKSIHGSKWGIVNQDKVEQSLIELASLINSEFTDYIVNNYM